VPDYGVTWPWTAPSRYLDRSCRATSDEESEREIGVLGRKGARAHDKERCSGRDTWCRRSFGIQYSNVMESGGAKLFTGLLMSGLADRLDCPRRGRLFDML
jgi:hypothetical protein